MGAYLYKAFKSRIFALAAIYILSHSMMCVISGIWWDDWTIWTYSSDTIKEMFRSAGVPWEAYNLFSVMWLPYWGYRIIVFLEYLLGGIFLYKILESLDLFSDKDAFWISAIYMTVPVNDIRVTLICYGYSLSLFLFLLAFFIVTRMKNSKGRSPIPLRIISLLLFLYSYTTGSLLVFTGILWLYLLYAATRQNKDAKCTEIVKIFVKSNWDYFLLPFVFYIVKGIFFKPYGQYVGYNSVTLKSLVKALLCLPNASVKTLNYIKYNYSRQISIISAAAIIICCFAYFMITRKNTDGRHKTSWKQDVLMFLFGGAVYLAGVFPYIVVRDGNAIKSTGVVGRDAMLAGFGIAISVWAFVRLVHFPELLQKVVFISMIVFGIIHFNKWYLNYQEDWYHQLIFAGEISDNEELADDTTILCDFSNAWPCGGTRFYTLNGMSYLVTGKMDKFYFSSIGDLSDGLKFSEYFTEGYNADDYDYTDMTIDSILLINNMPIRNADLIRMRFDEIFNHKKFEMDIDELKDIQYIEVSAQTSDKIYNAYENGTLDSIVLRELASESQ